MNQCKICGEELNEDEGWIPTGGEGYWCQDCYDEQYEVKGEG